MSLRHLRTWVGPRRGPVSFPVGLTLLPELEHGPTYIAININLTIDVFAGITARNATQSIYICRSDRQSCSFVTSPSLESGPIQASTIGFARREGANTSRTDFGLFLQNKSVTPSSRPGRLGGYCPKFR
jgi:hypothetical protein